MSKKDIIYPVTLFSAGSFLALIPGSSLTADFLHRVGYSAIVVAFLYIILKLSERKYSKEYKSSLDNLFASETGAFLFKPWFIQKDKDKLRIGIHRRYFKDALFFVVILTVLGIYTCFPLVLYIISPSPSESVPDSLLALSVLVVFIAPMATILYSVLMIKTIRENEQVVFEKNSKHFGIFKYNAIENLEPKVSQSIKNTILVPVKNMLRAEIVPAGYFQLLVPSDNAKGDKDYIKDYIKHTDEKIMIIQSRDETFVKKLYENILAFIGDYHDKLY